jgi:hypothetical protein
VACHLATERGKRYPMFNRSAHSADTLLPIVPLEIHGFWVPDESRSRGASARVYLWVHIAVGWAFGLLAVAGFSGLVKSDLRGRKPGRRSPGAFGLIPGGGDGGDGRAGAGV